MITLALLGPTDITVDGAAPPAELLWRKNQALLIYLACSPKRARSREHLIGLLWPDKPQGKARASLNEALRILRRAAGHKAVVTTADQVRLAKGAVMLDTEAFNARVEAEEWREAADLVQGEFLEGFAIEGASAFEDWITAERSAWRDRSVDALRRHAEALIDQGLAGDAGAAARRALQFDAVNEPTLRTLMRSLVVAGDRSGALREFEEFARRLKVELNSTPSAGLVALADRARQERQRRDAAPSALKAHETRRLPIVGRGRPLAALLRLWTRCTGRPQASLGMLAGVSGLGKTRLLEELTTRARLDGAVVAGIRAVEADVAVAWSGIFGMARGGLLDAAGLASAPARALACFTAELPEWADRFPAARRKSASRPAQALVEVLRAVAGEQPVVLSVDDAQWLDHESALALGSALRDLAPLPFYLVLAAAPHPPRPELDELQARIGRDVQGTAVGLEALTSADIRILARDLFPTYRDPELDRLARRIANDSAGLPLLAVELLHAVALGMDLHKAGAAWPKEGQTLDQTLPSELPSAVVGAVRVGFRRLSADAQLVLQAVAALGDRIPIERIGRATGLAPAACAAALDELEWQRWLLAEPRGYSFVARIIKEIVAQDLTGSALRQRLRDAAETDPT